jgi:SAM-dependent methyltransferase
MNVQQEHLKTLFGQASKHSNYQILPQCLKTFLDDKDIEVKSRYEKERLDYILSQISPAGKSILDIGGNTGYFTFEMLDRAAKRVDYYEGNKAHAEFVKVAADLLNFSEKINIFNEYYPFSGKSALHYDIVILLNVLHHVGDDYGDKTLSIEKAKEQIIESINYFKDKTEYLVFQLGFCWKGNRSTLLFENGTKEEMIDFIKAGTRKDWIIEEIAVPEKIAGEILYLPVDDGNIKRNDILGEFLNRPLFIMRSLDETTSKQIKEVYTT